MKLEGKKAVITGASRSIGQAIAVQFALEGADVAFSYHSDQKGAEMTAAMIEQLGREVAYFKADFTKEKEIIAFFEQALDALGAVDILVNNAAGSENSSIFDLKYKNLQNLLQVGVLAPMLLTQLASKKMIEQHSGGSIINISSIAGLKSYPESSAHSTTKTSLNRLTQSAALELAPYRIRVNAIAPGSTPYDEPGSAAENGEVPLLRYGSPEDHAKAALFFASHDSDWVTGQILAVDGGQTLL